MKTTGIIRKMDDLGRVVIPREIRQILGLKENTPFEIFLDKDRVIFKKYDAADSLTDRIRTIEVEFDHIKDDIDTDKALEISKYIDELKKSVESLVDQN